MYYTGIVTSDSERAILCFDNLQSNVFVNPDMNYDEIKRSVDEELIHEQSLLEQQLYEAQKEVDDLKNQSYYKNRLDAAMELNSRKGKTDRNETSKNAFSRYTKDKRKEKMMAKRINIILVISMIMIMFSFQSTSHVKAATQNTETTTGDIYFAVKYCENIAPRQDDVFVLTYRTAEDKNGDATAQITVNAYELLKEEQKITLPYGGYIIVNIEYQGSNAGITNYSAKNQMNATSNSNDTLTIYIGLTEVDKFDHSWTESQIIKHGGVNVRELTADPSIPISYEDKMAEMIKEETKRQEESKNIQIGSNENTIEATDEASSGD